MNPEIDAARQQTLTFLADNPIGVLATVDAEGRPHAATIYITHDRMLNFYFVTKKETEKARNLAANPHAAVAIFDARSQTTVQVDGVVSEVTDEKEVNDIFRNIQNIARQTSKSGVPPVTAISAGGYITYRLVSPSVRIAAFSDRDQAQGVAIDTIF